MRALPAAQLAGPRDMASLGAPWLGALDEPERLLAELGWQPALPAPGAPDANFGRWMLPVLLARLPDMPTPGT